MVQHDDAIDEASKYDDDAYDDDDDDEDDTLNDSDNAG